MSARILVVAAAALGCAQGDPCASSVGRSCVALEVRWRGSGPLVDQLEVVGTRGLMLPPRSRTPPAVTQPFSLPAVVPLEAGLFAGEFGVLVRALRDDETVGEGIGGGSLRAREHGRVAVELTAITAADAAVLDFTIGVPDGPAADFSRDDATPPCAVPASDELWVDDDAPDGGTGGLNCPLPTLTEALERARTSGSLQKLIHLRPGNYSRERFPILLRDGISIAGDDATTTIIQGTGPWQNENDTAFPPPGGQPIKAVMVVGSAASAANRIEHVTVRPEATLSQPDLNHYGIVCDRGTAPSTLGIEPPAPSLTLDDVEVGPHFFYGVVATNTFSAFEGCNLRVMNSRFVGGISGVHAVGALEGKLRVPVSVEVGLTTSGGNVFSNMGLLFNDSLGACAVDIFDDVSPVRVRQNQFISVGCGVIVSSKSAAALVEITDNQIQGARYEGIALTDWTKGVVSRNTISGVDYVAFSPRCLVHPALCLIESSQVIARSNTFVGNQVGVALRGDGVSPTRGMDFGRGVEGRNVFACNSRSAGDPGWDFSVFLQTDSSTATPIFARGNYWDHNPPSQSSGDGGDYYQMGTALPPAYDFGTPLLYTTPCPIGRNR